ncbi:hypothetical protein A5647_20235 [Mycobacterium sp. 1100029.7]|nr:hypothetical protein A5647_20235 [Mycobacterium sp. 1100029.7]
MDYPVDHARTTRQHAGETMKNRANAPGLVAVALGVVALVLGLYAFASHHATIGVVAVVLAVVVGLAGSIWLAYAHRKVRRAELQLEAMNPGVPAPPPSS